MFRPVRRRSPGARCTVSRRRYYRSLSIEPLETRATPATFTVNSFSDVINPNDNILTLREAITLANQDNIADTIVFDAAVFNTPRTIALTSAAVTGQQGLPAIIWDLNIVGPGADRLTVTRQTGVQDFRLLTVNSNVRLSLSGMTLTNPAPANPNSQFTGALFNNGGTVSAQNVDFINNRANLIGAAIVNANFSQLELRNSTVEGNISSGRGGAIVNEGVMVIDRSTIAANFSGLYGGGIYNEGTLSINNSTIAQNDANQWGGGISNGDRTPGLTGLMIVVNSTIVSNRADADGNDDIQDLGGGIWTEGSQDTALDNTIVAGNFRGLPGNSVRDDLNGAIVQVGSAHNVISDPATSGGMIDGLEGNIIGFDPNAPDFNNGDNRALSLDEIVVNRLANHGGFTDTYALQPDSPAIDNGVTRFMVTPMRVFTNTDFDLFPAFALIDNFGLDQIPTVENLPTTQHGPANPVPDPNNPGQFLFPSWVTDSTVAADYFDPVFGGEIPQLTFLLGGNVDLTELVVWGYTFFDEVTNPDGVSNNEARSFVVEFSIDGGLTFYDSVRVDQINRSGINNTRLPFDDVYEANVVRVTIIDNFFATAGATDGNRVGLGELKFIALAPPIDQRGVPRLPLPIDIGSFEGFQEIVLTNTVIVENVLGAIVGPIFVRNAPFDADYDFTVNDGRFAVVDGELRLKPDVSVSRLTEPTITLEITARDGSADIRQTFVLTVIENNFPWHNFALPEDANDDGLRDIDDAIFIIRLLRRGEGGALPDVRPPTEEGGHYGDVLPDNVLDIRDAIAVIRYLRRVAAGDGESETSLAVMQESAPLVTSSPTAGPNPWDLALLGMTAEDARSKRPR